MVEYKCERCYYIAKKKGDYRRHLQRKYPCKTIHSQITIEELLEKLNKPKEGFACNKCNKIFTSSQGKYQHQKRCKQELVVYEEKKNDNQKIQDLENELKLMKELFIEKLKNVQSITNNNNNNICVTYWINKLQRIKSDKPILVTLNPQLNRLPSKQEIIKKLSFRHPVLDKNYLKAQKVLEEHIYRGLDNTVLDSDTY